MKIKTLKSEKKKINKIHIKKFKEDFKKNPSQVSDKRQRLEDLILSLYNEVGVLSKRVEDLEKRII
jgi:hypothetical protein